MRKRLTYANVASTLALILALGTGGAWAVDKISGKVLKNRSVAGKKLKKNTVTGRQVRESTLKIVPRAKEAQTLAGSLPTAFLAANGTAANSAQLGGIGPGGFIQGNGTLTTGRTTGEGGPDPNVIRTFETPIGEFTLGCGVANADVRYHNTTPGDADVFRGILYSGAPDTDYDLVPSGDAEGFAATAGTGPATVDIRAAKGDTVAILRVGEVRTGPDCIWNWELITPG